VLRYLERAIGAEDVEHGRVAACTNWSTQVAATYGDRAVGGGEHRRDDRKVLRRAHPREHAGRTLPPTSGEDGTGASENVLMLRDQLRDMRSKQTVRGGAEPAGPDAPCTQWIAENEGVPPDIEVLMDAKSVAQGRDPQLERAVAEVLEMLAENPRRVVTPPAFSRPSKKPGGR
jgi:hypothetical protein